MGANGEIRLEKEDHQRDADFKKAMHGKSAAATGGFTAIFAKDKEGKKAAELARDEYFKHFDGKRAETETDAEREVCCNRRSAIPGLFRPLTRRVCLPNRSF